MRRALLLPLLLAAGCCLSVTQEGPAASTAGSSSGGTTGGIPGCGTTTGASAPLPLGPCGPGTFWVGDTCVVNCAAPVATPIDAMDNTCLLPDAGFGNCADGACLAAGDPGNCGGLGLVCPPPWSCLASAAGSYCGSLAGEKWMPFSCDAGRCPEAAPECVPQRGCVSQCGRCGDNQSCSTGATLGFCCGGECQAFGPDDTNCAGCGLGCGAGTICSGGACGPPPRCSPAENGAACDLRDGGMGACCDGLCANPGAQCRQVSSCATATEGASCAFSDGGDGECCGSRCSDLMDSDNCGGCGVSCGPDAFCAEGYCKPLLDCAKGGGGYQDDCSTDGGAIGSCCGSICIDLARDPLNCGTCGAACPLGGICDSSSGHPTECVNALGLPLPCDGGAQCSSGRTCLYGGCVSPTCDDYRTTFCASDGGGGFCCGTVCTTSDLGCGGACPAGTVPSTSSDGCTSPDGGSPCGPGAMCPPGTFCQTEDRECEPINSCLRSTQTPGLSFCRPGTYEYGSCCGNTCVDFLQDPDNCGGCGVVCSTGICISEAARVGTFWPLCLPAGPTNDCLLSCPTDSVCLQGRCINGVGYDQNLPFCLAENGTIGVYCEPGVCANPRDDPQNCGSCGNACGPGQSCISGSCTGQQGCGNGREDLFCNLDAGPSFTCCPSVGCTDTATDPNNCGYCSVRCLSGTSCVDGYCR